MNPPTHVTPYQRYVNLERGPLDGCRVRVAPGATYLRIPGAGGRYVELDSTAWTWETDHRPELYRGRHRADPDPTERHQP